MHLHFLHSSRIMRQIPNGMLRHASPKVHHYGGGSIMLLTPTRTKCRESEIAINKSCFFEQNLQVSASKLKRKRLFTFYQDNGIVFYLIVIHCNFTLHTDRRKNKSNMSYHVFIFFTSQKPDTLSVVCRMNLEWSWCVSAITRFLVTKEYSLKTATSPWCISNMDQYVLYKYSPREIKKYDIEAEENQQIIQVRNILNAPNSFLYAVYWVDLFCICNKNWTRLRSTHPHQRKSM